MTNQSDSRRPTPDDINVFAALKNCSLAELFTRAEQFQLQGDFATSASLYRKWIASNSSNPLLNAAYYNYGVALAKAGDPFGAINATLEAIRLNPDFYPPYINLGRLFEDIGQTGVAVEKWLAMLARAPHVTGESVKNKLAVLEQLGRVLEANNHDAAAEDALRQSLEISVQQPKVLQHWISLRQRQCKWPIMAPWQGVTARDLIDGISPLSVANQYDDPIFHLAKAWKYNKEFVAEPKDGAGVFTHAPRGQKKKKKLRIGYVSSDLRQHAVGFAMTDVVEQHDRERVEVFAYYCGIDRDDNIRQRIRRSVDSWLEINGLSEDEAAAAIHRDQIDILVDLNGYTKDARTAVFARRPAPIAVNWFGFPGTMASPYHHYVIADERIVPLGCEIFFTEKVLRLACYQPNDRKREVSTAPPSRAAEGLPDNAFVYCCLNGMQKTTPEVFLSWMRILTATPGSVLWLLGGTEDTNQRLRSAAEQLGIPSQRLIFAQKKGNPEHVARYALADLFLDTFPYGAHTTAADAIWMGIPIVTRPGLSFASRVCASLLHAADMDELICETISDYEKLAVDLGRSPQRVASLKSKLAANRESSLLFDTPKLVRDLEDLYFEMWRDFQSGRLPSPDLSNLDIYHDIGLDLHAVDAIASSFDELKGLYQSRLAGRHKVRPLRADGRLVPAAWG